MSECTRCKGTGQYGTFGACYTCKGTGKVNTVQSNPNQTKGSVLTMTNANSMQMGVTNEMQIQTFETIIAILEAKGANNKMCSIFDIHNKFKEFGIETSKIMIEAVIDVLIQKKYVRYFRNDRGYIYFGITGLGWTRYNKRIISGTDVPLTATETAIPDEQIPPEGFDQPNLTPEQQAVIDALPDDDKPLSTLTPEQAKARIENEWKTGKVVGSKAM